MAAVASKTNIPFLTDLLNKTLCESTKVRDIAPKWANVITAKTSDSIYDVFKLFIDHSIITVPLYNVDLNQYIGFIDIVDIISYISEELKYPIDRTEDWINSPEFHELSCCVINPIGTCFPIRRTRNSWCEVNEDAPLKTAIKEFSLSRSHYMGVFNIDGKLTRFITKSCIIEFISKFNMDLGEAGEMNIDTLSLVSKDLVTVDKNENIINAFRKIHNRDISSIGVIDEKCSIIGNITISDFKLFEFSNSMFRKLFITSDEFLNLKIKHQSNKMIWVYKASTLKDLIEKFKENKVQRVYVVTKEDMLYGVITLTNIMKLFNLLLEKSMARR